MINIKAKFKDERSVQVRGKVTCGEAVIIGSNVILEGEVILGNNVIVGDNVKIVASRISNKSEIKDFSLIEYSEIGDESFIGPFARLRPNTRIGANCQIGNYVEIKNSNIFNNVRINHMAFIGDAEIADDVTIGAGVITCNHDGIKTNKTLIGKGAYIGSNVNLIAPITVNQNAVIGSGSTVNQEVPANKLTIARVKQKVIESWKGFKK